jgi:diguanylate cyclase (GGDEF)-like protein/PAS domain S-box-containing protein
MAPNEPAEFRDIGLPDDLIRAAKADLPFAALLDAQSRIIDLLACDRDLHETLSEITQLVEALAPPALCTILLMQPDGRHLRIGAAPSLPERYNQFVDGLEIGPVTGSCGTAAYRRQAVIVSDIATDPLWEVPRDFTLAAGLRACWSMPILDERGVVLGTVAMYYREQREPTGRDWALLEPAARLIRLALAQQRRKDELREAEAEKRQAAALELKRMRLLSDVSQEILIIARDGIILQVNAAGGRMLGGAEGQLAGRRMLELIAEADRPAVMRRLNGRAADLDHEEIHLQAPAGTLVPVEFSCTTIDYEGEPATVLAFRDLSDRKRDEARIRFLAHHDALTNLPNRFLLRERLTQALGTTNDQHTTLALLYLDLDYFKPVNDLLGHAAGDALLIQVASRLQAELRSTDTLARVGGDEFVVVALFDRPEDTAGFAARLVAALARPFVLGTDQVEIGVSVGIALYPRDGDSQEALIRAADTALYRAKHDERGTFRFFEPTMDARSQARQRLERDLRHAVEREEMQLYYQPIVNCATGAVLGFEALLRWHHPEFGVVLPREFIALAEKTGLIAPIGQWAIETAGAAAAGWQRPHWLAVNVSPVQLRLSDLPGIISDTLARTGLPASRLEIEITEGLLIEDPRRAGDILSTLHARGVRIALDDFGTGYSSLGHLQKFRFDKLKIDRSFITRLGESDDATIIVRTIIGLAHSLGLSVTAEGVETPQQLASLRELMCDQVQGYLLGRPMQMDGPSELTTARARMRVSGKTKGLADDRGGILEEIGGLS